MLISKFLFTILRVWAQGVVTMCSIIHCIKLIYILDAVTIVLFQVLGAFANIEFDENRDQNIARDVSSLLYSIGTLFYQLVYNLLCGRVHVPFVTL